VVFISTQTEPVITIGATDGTDRAPVTIGPSFFSSYGTFPATSYIAGINLAVNGSAGISTREWEASYISKALGDKLEMLEIGNEPDLFIYWNRRPASWNVTDYVAEWQAASQVIETGLAWTNPELSKKITYFAPSFAGTDVGAGPNSMGPLPAFEHGLNVNKNIQQLSGHKYVLFAIHSSTSRRTGLPLRYSYMGSATGAGVTLQSTLMNHTAIVNSIANHVTLAQQLQPYCAGPYVMGETNSLSGGGASGLSNVFGAAL
jgi:hypothetical protein